MYQKRHAVFYPIYLETKKWVEKRGAAKFFKTDFEVSGYQMKN